MLYICSPKGDIMQYNELLEKQIIGRLRLDNPWWTEKEIAHFYAQMHPRLYLDIFYPLVAESDLRRAIILMGPRRVGKTVMIFHTIQRLLANGVSPQNIIYPKSVIRDSVNTIF